MGFQKADYEIVANWEDDNQQRLRNQIKTDGTVDVVVAAGGPVPALIGKDETQVVKKPIVFTTVADPIGNGLVGDNLTGMAGQTSECDDDRVEILSELLAAQRPPRNRKVHLFFKRGRPKLQEHKRHLKDVATGLNIDLSDDEVDDCSARPGFCEQAGRCRWAPRYGGCVFQQSPKKNRQEGRGQ